jgi:hypothetical protein
MAEQGFKSLKQEAEELGKRLSLRSLIVWVYISTCYRLTVQLGQAI